MSCPFAEPTPRRRLTIAHLMLWTLGCAIALGFYRGRILAEQRPDDRFAAAQQVFALIYCLPAGARIGGVLLFAWMMCRGDKSFPTQPGHWLLLCEGISVLLQWLGRTAIILIAGFEERPIYLFWASQLPNCIATAVAYGIALSCSSNESRLWKATFTFLLLEHILAAVTSVGLAFYFATGPGAWRGIWSLYDLQYRCCPLLLAVALPIVALADPKRRQTDFLHWTGIIAVTASSLFNVLFRWLITYFR